MNLKKIIWDNLKIPVIEDFAPIHTPCVTFYSSNDSTALIGNGNPTEETETFQIDIWCKKNTEVKKYTRMLKAIIQETKGCTIPIVFYSYDNNGKTWRGNITFEHLREDIDYGN